MNNKNDFFCIMPWVNLYKHTDDTIKLCCLDNKEGIGSLRKDTLDEIRNGYEFKKIRRMFLNGEIPDRCHYCVKLEKDGIKSLRQSQLDWYNLYNYNFDFDENPKDILILDYRANNLCNLACKTCCPDFSYLLASTHLESKNISKKEFDMFVSFKKSKIDYKQIDKILETVKSIYFAGGEPMIIDEHWYILNKLIELKRYDVEIRYTTNLTKLKYKNNTVEHCWEILGEKRPIIVSASVDGIGDVLEWLRTNSKWDEIKSNLISVSKIKNVKLEISSTVGWMNILSTIKLNKYVFENGIINDLNKFNLNPIYSPEGSSFNCTPPEIVDELIESLQEYKNWILSNITDISKCPELINQLNTIIENIKKSIFNDDNFYHWIKNCEVIDRKYGLINLPDFGFKDTEIVYKIINKVLKTAIKEGWTLKTQMYNTDYQ